VGQRPAHFPDASFDVAHSVVFVALFPIIRTKQKRRLDSVISGDTAEGLSCDSPITWPSSVFGINAFRRLVNDGTVRTTRERRVGQHAAYHFPDERRGPCNHVASPCSLPIARTKQDGERAPYSGGAAEGLKRTPFALAFLQTWTWTVVVRCQAYPESTL